MASQARTPEREESRGHTSCSSNSQSQSTESGTHQCVVDDGKSGKNSRTKDSSAPIRRLRANEEIYGPTWGRFRAQAFPSESRSLIRTRIVDAHTGCSGFHEAMLPQVDRARIECTHVHLQRIDHSQLLLRVCSMFNRKFHAVTRPIARAPRVSPCTVSDHLGSDERLSRVACLPRHRTARRTSSPTRTRSRR